MSETRSKKTKLTLPRGFKALAERRAAEERAKLGLKHDQRLDPFALASQVGLRIVPLSALASSEILDPVAAKRLLGDGRKVFSGAYYPGCDNCPPWILLNDSHAATRQASNVVHECSHHLLNHIPTQPFDSVGCRSWNPEQEAQAEWLAGPLLIPRQGALWAIRSGMSEAEGADHFGVSPEMFRWRANATGAMRQTLRARRSPRLSS